MADCCRVGRGCSWWVFRNMGYAPRIITSPRNPRIKAIEDLRDNRRRKRADMFLVEGAREIRRALAAGLEPACFVVGSHHLDSDDARAVIQHAQSCKIELLQVADAILRRLSIRNIDGHVLAVVRKPPALTLEDLSPHSKPFLVAVSGVEKPGNLGAIVRTTDGAGADALVVVDGLADPYHPHAIRASIGAVFSLPVVSTSTSDWLKFLQGRQIDLVGAALTENSVPHYHVDFDRPTCILLGGEAGGLSGELLQACQSVVRIPMNGISDSLNVSVAAAVLSYEVQRQRAVSSDRR